ncbi:MAG: uracil-DNA glycosylase family protein [Candidatus Micrarchaeia archaeon]
MKFEFDGGVVIFKRGTNYKFLFLNRKEGFLDLPKGHIEKGESVEQAAVREAGEESGLKVKLDPFYRYRLSYWFYFNGEKIKKEVTFFIAEVPKNAKVKISKEHTGYIWLDYNSAMKLVKFRNTRELIKDAFDYIKRRDKLEKMNIEYRKLPKRYKDWDLSKRLVEGEGPANAKIAIIGQAPGDTEDKEGRPFIGRSGKLLDHLLDIADIKRREAYVTSVVQFFPPKNRAPSNWEIESCKKFLIKQMKVIKPRLIILLGNIAAQEIIGKGKIMAHHGEVIRRNGTFYFITLHPAAAVRIKKNMPIIEEDFRKLKRLINKIAKNGK